MSREGKGCMKFVTCVPQVASGAPAYNREKLRYQRVSQVAVSQLWETHLLQTEK